MRFVLSTSSTSPFVDLEAFDMVCSGRLVWANSGCQRALVCFMPGNLVVLDVVGGLLSKVIILNVVIICCVFVFL